MKSTQVGLGAATSLTATPPASCGALGPQLCLACGFKDECVPAQHSNLKARLYDTQLKDANVLGMKTAEPLDKLCAICGNRMSCLVKFLNMCFVNEIKYVSMSSATNVFVKL